MAAVYTRQRNRISRFFIISIACMLGVLILGCYACFVRQLDKQSRAWFLRECDFLCDTIASRPDVGREWLNQMASSHKMLIAVEKNGVETMRSNEPGPDNHAVETAWEEAMRLYAFDHAKRPNLFHDPEKEDFPLKSAGTEYRVCLAKLSVGQDWFSFTILMDRTYEQNLMIRMRRVFTGAGLAAIAALGWLAWMVKGRALRLLKKNRDIQVELLTALFHELRHGLSMIQTIADDIQEATPEEARQLAKTTARETARLSSRALHFLDLRSGRGRDAKLSPHDPSYILLTLFERYEGCAREKGIVLHADIPERALPSINCSPEDFKQVLCVLIENALRYTPAGGYILLQVERQRRYVAFTVSDSGKSIPYNQEAGVFRRFYRSLKHERYDLDLTYVLEYCLFHGGELLVDVSELGGGALTVKIPCAKK